MKSKPIKSLYYEEKAINFVKEIVVEAQKNLVPKSAISFFVENERTRIIEKIKEKIEFSPFKDVFMELESYAPRMLDNDQKYTWMSEKGFDDLISQLKEEK